MKSVIRKSIGYGLTRQMLAVAQCAVEIEIDTALRDIVADEVSENGSPIGPRDAHAHPITVDDLPRRRRTVFSMGVDDNPMRAFDNLQYVAIDRAHGSLPVLIGGILA